MRITTVVAGAIIAGLAQGCARDGAPTSAGAPASPAAVRDVDPAGVPQVAVACGATVTADVRLEHDLDCPGNGFTVSGTGIRINLNGHTMAGAGVGNGITINASSDVSILGGTIRGFVVGIFVNVTTGLELKDTGLTGNGTAVLLQGSSGNTLKALHAWQNTLRAFMVRPTLTGILSTNNDFTDNQLIDNPTGIYLIRQPGNVIKGNTISGASVAAIDLFPGGASGNVVKGNLLTASAVGIRFTDGWTGNTVLENTLDANGCAIQGPTAGNTLLGNTFSANTVDYCP
jgi:parallel beta-helix repeat protein